MGQSKSTALIAKCFTLLSGALQASSCKPQNTQTHEYTEGSESLPTHGRILGSSLQQKLDELIDEDPELCCPVSPMLFAEPVIASDGFIYDKASLTTLLAN